MFGLGLLHVRVDAHPPGPEQVGWILLCIVDLCYVCCSYLFRQVGRIGGKTSTGLADPMSQKYASMPCGPQGLLF